MIRTDPDELLAEWGRLNAVPHNRGPRLRAKSSLAGVQAVNAMGESDRRTVPCVWPLVLYVERTAGFWDARPALFHRFVPVREPKPFDPVDYAFRRLESPIVDRSFIGPTAPQVIEKWTGATVIRLFQARSRDEALAWLGWDGTGPSGLDLRDRGNQEIEALMVHRFWITLEQKCRLEPRVFEPYRPVPEGFHSELTQRMADLASSIQMLRRGCYSLTPEFIGPPSPDHLRRMARADKQWRRLQEIYWEIHGPRRRLREVVAQRADMRARRDEEMRAWLQREKAMRRQ